MSDSVLKLENTSIFQDKNLILSDINIDVKKGEFVYLIGKTGSGKSSLLKTLYGDLKLNHGKGEIVGFNLETLKDKKIPFLRRKLGIVFQDFKLLNERTVHGNLKFVLQATGWKEREKINQKIEAGLQAEETDTLRLSELIAERHKTLLLLLSKLSETEKKAFAKAEIPINEYLNTFIGAMLKESGDMLASLNKGRHAIKQYQQV